MREHLLVFSGSCRAGPPVNTEQSAGGRRFAFAGSRWADKAAGIRFTKRFPAKSNTGRSANRPQKGREERAADGNRTDYIKSQETVKAVVRLRERAERERRRLFFCEGVHLAEEFLRHNRPVERVFVTDAALKAHGALLSKLGCQVTPVTPEVYAKLSEEKAPQGLLLVAPYPENISEHKPSVKCGAFSSTACAIPAMWERSSAQPPRWAWNASSSAVTALTCSPVKPCARRWAPCCVQIFFLRLTLLPRCAPSSNQAARSMLLCFPARPSLSLPTACRRIFLSSSATRDRACGRTLPRYAPAVYAFRRPTVREPQCSRCCRDFYVGDEKNG